MDKQTIYFITGVNRGLGYGLLTTLLQRPHTTIIGSVRNTNTVATLTTHLSTTTKHPSSTYHLITLDFSNTSTPTLTPTHLLNLLSTLTPTTPIPYINTLILNAGNTTSMSPTLLTTNTSLLSDYQINTIAPLTLIQSLFPLLTSSPTPPKVIYITSSLGSIAAQEPVPAGAYGPSKAAMNWIMRSLHLQLGKEGVVSVAIHPGFVKTDMGELAAKEWGYIIRPEMTVGESVVEMLKIIDEATREKYSGKMVSWSGAEIPW